VRRIPGKGGILFVKRAVETESGLKQLVRQQARALEAANAALQQSQQVLATELDAAQRLQHVATKLINANGIEALYEEILDTAAAILDADFASIQMLYPKRGTRRASAPGPPGVQHGSRQALGMGITYYAHYLR